MVQFLALGQHTDHQSPLHLLFSQVRKKCFEIGRKNSVRWELHVFIDYEIHESFLL